MVTPRSASKQAPAARSGAAWQHYAQARAAATIAFTKTHRIRAFWRALTQATDALLLSAPLPEGTALVAVGGYGRRELFPFSDVDVLLLLPEAADTGAEHGVIRILQSLWDQQIPVSHATRTLPETIALAGRDATVCAALIDARYLAGDRKLYLGLKRQLRAEVFGQQSRQFVEAKLAERDARHARYGDSRFLLEPNVKEGKGALRDLQTLNWLMRYCYGTHRVQDVVRDDMLSAAEWRHYRQAYLFFATVRAQLHLLRGRADDRLGFDVQPTIAAALGFRGATPQEKAERLMLRYFQFARAVGNMTRILCATLEEQALRARPADFLLDGVARQLPDSLTIEHGRLNFSPQADVMEHLAHIIDLFAHAQRHQLDIHPRAQLALSRLLPRMGRRLPLDGESNRLFMQILLSPQAPELTLRRMNEMGVLAALVPEFGRLCGQMQYDGYHTYTVDEHILVAIGNLRQLEQGEWAKTMPLATSLAQEARDRDVLYTAMLCHDIAKGTGGKHAQTGARMAQIIATRFGLREEESAVVSWLVAQHTLLSDTAFKRDLDDPQTIADFVAIVQSPERLRLLLLVTVADIRAVGPTIFNGWKGALMRTLYQRAVARMGVGDNATSTDEGHHALIAQWHAAPTLPAIAITHDAFRDVTVIACCMEAVPHLFTVLTGVIAAVGGSIVSARIRSLTEEHAHLSLAEFHVQDRYGKSFAQDEKRLRRLPELIMEALKDPAALAQKLAARRVVTKSRAMPVRSAVFIDNQVSAQASVVEINARDRIGLLYTILQTMDDNQLQVQTAHIATYGQLAVDVFYVKDAYGHKLTHTARQAQLQHALHAAIGDMNDGA